MVEMDAPEPLNESDKEMPVIVSMDLKEANYISGVFQLVIPQLKAKQDPKYARLAALRESIESTFPSQAKLLAMDFMPNEEARKEIAESPAVFPLSYNDLSTVGQVMSEFGIRVPFDSLKKAYTVAGGKGDYELESLTYEVHKREVDLPPNIADLIKKLGEDMKGIGEIAFDISTRLELKEKYDKMPPEDR